MQYQADIYNRLDEHSASKTASVTFQMLLENFIWLQMQRSAVVCSNN